jgi:hypothetical protein
VRFSVSEEFGNSTLNCEENVFGGIWIWCFLGFWSGFHVKPLRRGGTTVFYGVFGGTLNWGTRLNVNGVTYES